MSSMSNVHRLNVNIIYSPQSPCPLREWLRRHRAITTSGVACGKMRVQHWHFQADGSLPYGCEDLAEEVRQIRPYSGQVQVRKRITLLRKHAKATRRFKAQVTEVNSMGLQPALRPRLEASDTVQELPLHLSCNRKGAAWRTQGIFWRRLSLRRRGPLRS